MLDYTSQQSENGFRDTGLYRSLNGWYRNGGKRTLDIAGASAGLILTFPIMGLAAAGIKVEGWLNPEYRRSVFYEAERIGRGGSPFTMYKFQSMRNGAKGEEREMLQANGAPSPDARYIDEDSDPRITPWGRILRRTKVDELPNLWNILTGDISISGNRPPSPEEHEHRVEAMGEEKANRLVEWPGLTGPAQTYGGRRISDRQRRRIEALYEPDLLNDFGSIVRTPFAVLREMV